MLELDFKTFIERLDVQKRIDYPTVHYMESDIDFKIFFKNHEHWKYYTVIKKSNIIEFGRLHNINEKESLDDFRMEYLNGCILIEQEEMKELVHKDSLDKNFNEIDAGEDVIEESDDYSTYLEKKVSSWENKVIKAIENIEIEKSFDYNKKTFGEFLSGLMNAINTKGFLNNIRRFIKININSSIESVEEELNLNIGFTSKFDDLLDKFTIEQFDGYNINGKRWPGIKGATKQTQFKILKTVEENLANGNTRAEMIKNVRGVFKGSTLKQATAIARTETTRFLAEAKLLSYKESGVEGNKAPSAANDSRTSELCRRLDAKYRNIGVPLDEEYYDDVTGKSFQNPNHHVNCRCTLEFIPSKK